MDENRQIQFFNESWDQSHRKILGYITAKCGNPEDIEDIFQETFTEFYRVLQRKGCDYIQNSEAFLMQIAKRKIYKYYSFREKLAFVVPKTQRNDEGEEYDLTDLDLDRFTVEDEIVTRDMMDRVSSFLKQKPPDVRKIFYLFYVMDFKIREIASLMDITESNVKHKLYRTLKELREIYAGKEDQ